MYHPYKIVSKLEIDKSGGCFLNPRRVELLLLIRERGSILAASKELRMSYQQAWTIIKELNVTASLPLVSRQRGGTNGGGAVLTNFGMKILERYSAIQRKYAQMLLDLDDDLQQLCAF